MDYIEVIFRFYQFSDEIAEILIAELDPLGYDSFYVAEQKLHAYIEKEGFREENLHKIPLLQEKPANIIYSCKKLKAQNWNKIWEENFKYIEINDCIVKAPFHDDAPKKKYEIIISPQMSFGTGHHPTTYLMIAYLLETKLKGKHVLDMGCGTGILAILAARKECQKAVAIDIEEWAFQNALDNIHLNNLQNIDVIKGDKTNIPDQNFDLILANINRNILLEDIPAYSKHLNKKGMLILSGFYTSDDEVIINQCINHKLHPHNSKERNNWSALSFLKD